MIASRSDGNSTSQCCVGDICDAQICGNGALEAPEACDDGNTSDGDDCSALCAIEDADRDGVADGEDNCLDFPVRYENAIVMRTFSKSFSLAGMRIGVAVANPAIISAFLKTKDSYNMNAFSQAAGLAAIEDYEYMEANTAKIRATRSASPRRPKRAGARSFDLYFWYSGWGTSCKGSWGALVGK